VAVGLAALSILRAGPLSLRGDAFLRLEICFLLIEGLHHYSGERYGSIRP
jgi:hypothetical protein